MNSRTLILAISMLFFLSNPRIASAQQIISEPLTLDAVNLKISIQQTLLQNLDTRIATVHAHSSDPNYTADLNKLETVKVSVQGELTKWENVKISILDAQQKGIPTPVITGDPEADRANAQKIK